MAYAKTSLRGEQRALRRRMHDAGMSRGEIAAELTRRYRLRPRAAWRYAHGWSLTEAAGEINDRAAGAGLGNGSTVAMAASHLSEYENWPGHGREPTGRKPTPYVLSLLAMAYECTVHDLLDAADHQHLPAADRLVLNTTGPGRTRPHEQGPSAQGPSAQGPLAQGPLAQGPLAQGPLAQELVTGGAGAGQSPEHGELETGPGTELADARNLAWGCTPAEVARAMAGLVDADIGRRAVIASAWTAAALTEPLGRWLLDPADHQVTSAGARRVGRADVDAVWSMCLAFSDADHRLGGGHARQALAWYVHDVVTPMLGGAYTDQVGRELFTAAARLCDVAGFMCFDSGHQGLGQRYFVSGLRMAKMSGSQAIGANILGDMSMQAQFQRHPQGAVALADAAVSAARESGSASMLAYCHAIRARALALRGDASGSDQALNQAERAFDRADPGREPSWFAFYTPRQLAAEWAWACADLGRASLVQRHAADALSATDSIREQRHHILITTTLATSYLPAEDAPRAGGDVEQACAVLRGVLPVLGSLTSARALGQVSAFRKRLADYAQLAAVQELERDLDQCLAGTAA